MKNIMVSNNSMVYNKFSEKLNIILIEGELIDVLERVRDEVHDGRKILTHPLTGSVKPNETPFKSIIISDEKEKLCFESLQLIENSIDTAKKLLNDKKPRQWPQEILEDFMLIDYNLILSGYESMTQFL